MAQTVTYRAAEKATNTSNRHNPWWANIIAQYKAKRQARKIMRSLDEAHQIHSGKKQGKSFEDFLAEF